MIEKVMKNLIKKRKEVLSKCSSLREDFRKKEKVIRADLEKASRLWKEVSKKFKWWQSLP